MDPLLATAAVQIGGKLLDRWLDNSPAQATHTVDTNAFSNLLERASGAGLATEPSLADTLHALGIDSVEALDVQLSALTQQLREHAQLPAAAHALLENPRATLSVSPEGQSSIRLDDTRVVLPAESEVAALAQRIHELSSLRQAHALVPFSPLAEFAERFTVPRLYTAHWVLPES